MSREALAQFGAVIFGLAALIFLPLGLACLCMDLSGMFCYYKGGGIYDIRFHKRLADDTPKNRRRLSRICGAVWLLAGGGAALSAAMLLW